MKRNRLEGDEMKNEGRITVDLRGLSKDTRAMLRWVARHECSLNDDDREQEDDLDALMGVDEKLLRRVEHKIRRMRFRLDPDEAKCLNLLIESVGDRLGGENVKDVDALMQGDDEAYMEPYPFLPRQPNADREEQDEELTRLQKLLSGGEDDPDWDGEDAA